MTGEELRRELDHAIRAVPAPQAARHVHELESGRLELPAKERAVQVVEAAPHRAQSEALELDAELPGIELLHGASTDSSGTCSTGNATLFAMKQKRRASA